MAEFVNQLNLSLSESPLEIQSHRPQLCYFMSRLAFHNWNGKGYPFDSWNIPEDFKEESKQKPGAKIGSVDNWSLNVRRAATCSRYQEI